MVVHGCSAKADADPLVHAFALRSDLDRAQPKQDEESRDDLQANRFVDRFSEPLSEVVRVAYVSRSVNISHLANVARGLAIFEVPLKNTSHVEDSRMIN
nr:unnamed protein product [Fasciola hepatica]